MRFSILSLAAIFGTAFAGHVKIKNNCGSAVNYWVVTQQPPASNGPFTVNPGYTTPNGQPFAEGGWDIKVAPAGQDLSGPHLDWAMNVNSNTKTVVYDVNNIYSPPPFPRVKIEHGGNCPSIDSQGAGWRSGALAKNCHGDIANDFTLTLCA